MENNVLNERILFHHKFLSQNACILQYYCSTVLPRAKGEKQVRKMLVFCPLLFLCRLTFAFCHGILLSTVILSYFTR